MKSIRTDPRNHAAEGDERPDYELWRREDSRTGGYQWMVWLVGPMGGEDAEWFTDEDEARSRFAHLMGES